MTKLNHNCQMCGKEFLGGPRAMFCPACRRERQRWQNRENKLRKKQGQVRALGSTDICALCSQPYIVQGGLQRYCPACAIQQQKEHDRSRALAYYAAHKEEINPKRKEKRKLVSEEKRYNQQQTCVICGKKFIPRSLSRPASVCSPACAKERRRRYDKQYYEKRKQEI